jgi:hypothetical protein
LTGTGDPLGACSSPGAEVQSVSIRSCAVGSLSCRCRKEEISAHILPGLLTRSSYLTRQYLFSRAGQGTIRSFHRGCAALPVSLRPGFPAVHRRARLTTGHRISGTRPSPAARPFREGWSPAGMPGRDGHPAGISAALIPTSPRTARKQAARSRRNLAPPVIQAVRQLGHHLPVPAVPAPEQPQRQHEVHHQPGRQQPPALLPGARRPDNLIDQVRRERPGQHPDRDPVRQPAVRRQTLSTIMSRKTITS